MSVGCVELRCGMRPVKPCTSRIKPGLVVECARAIHALFMTREEEIKEQIVTLVPPAAIRHAIHYAVVWSMVCVGRMY